MAVVFIPALLRDLADGHAEVNVKGATVREVILALDRAYPGFAARLLDADGVLRSNLAVAVDGEIAVDALKEPVEAGSEVHFVAAIKGGADA